MARNVTLTKEEQGAITAFRRVGWSERRIARELGRSKTVVHNFISVGPRNYNRKSSGRRRKLPAKDERRIVQLAVNENLSTTEIRSRLQLTVCKQTICNVIKRSGHVTYRKKTKKPPFTKMHKQKRLAFAKNCMPWSDKWLSVIFSDE